MIRKILTISGRPGLYRLVSQGKNMLIVEELSTGKRMPAYARDKVSSLGDISIYTLEGDKPLAEVFEAVKELEGGEKVDIAGKGDLKEYFLKVLPAFDVERVHVSDIRKLLSWYNRLLEAGITEFVEKEEEKPTEEA